MVSCRQSVMGACYHAAFQEREGPKDMGATATVQYDADTDADAQAVYAKSLEVNRVSFAAFGLLDRVDIGGREWSMLDFSGE